jgi:hypothetical protein
MKKYWIELEANDLGQILDGLEVRARQWEDTASYLRIGESSDEFFMPEECRDVEEADHVARRYRSIIAEIRRQQKEQT